MKHFATLLLLCLISTTVSAQMTAADGSVRYGNEWIDYEADYLRIPVAADGLLKVSKAQLDAAGIGSANLALYRNGESVPFDLTADGVVFYGEKNRGDLDRFLFPTPETMQLNPAYSMYTDTAVYYLGRGADGRRYVPATVVGTPQERTDLLRTATVVASEHYTKSFFRASSASIYYSHYDVADGFGSRSSNDLLSSNGDRSVTVNVPVPGAYGGTSTLTVRYGTGFDGHRVDVLAEGEVLGTTAVGGWSVQEEEHLFLPQGEEVEVTLRGNAGDRDKPNLAFARVDYRASTAVDEAFTTFIVPAAAVPTRIRLTGLGGGAGAGEVIKSYARDGGFLVEAPLAADGSATFVFPASANDVTYQLATSSTISDAPAATYRFPAVLPTDARTNYLLLTSRRLHGAALDQLADYRRSPAGGSYRVQVVDVEDLYDGFAYGVARHPMAIRNYVAAARAAAPELQYLFLVGKGREYLDVRTAEQLTAAQPTYFIPSFGFPASDNLLTAKLGDIVPTLATGRLSAINEGEIAIYLQKLRDVEAQINSGEQTIADRDWMKQFLHLGGGGTPGEQSSIKSRLARMTDTIEQSFLAANVTAFFKTSSEPIEDSRQTAIFDRINGGTAMITFMGHSSSQTFDFSIDDPNNYANAGKYPFMLSLGCYSGDAFTEARSISERFLFLRDKGAIAFAASKGLGYIGALGQWGAELYGNVGTDTYGMGIGDAMQAAIRNFRGTSNFTLAILLEQFALSGDPAYSIHPRPGADLVIDPASVRFEPEVVPAQNPTFTVNLRLLNLGTKAATDSVTLRFRQELPSGEIVALRDVRVAAPAYDAELTFELPNPGLAAVGQNQFLVAVDADNDLSELPLPGAESNNNLMTGGRLGIPLTFIANTARVAFPPQYGVIGGEMELVASTTDALAPEREYVIQVSPNRKFTTLLADDRVTSPGGVIRHTPAITPRDSATYYWRISPDSSFTEGAGFIWSESSFTWLAGQDAGVVGWAMQDPGQMVDGEFENILGDTLREGWNAARSVTDIKIFNALYQNRSMPRFEYNGQRFNSPHLWHIRSGIQMIVIDSTNSRRWYPNLGRGDYGTRPIRNSSWDFQTATPEGRAGMIRFLQEFVPNGAYVMLYSVQRGEDIDYVNSDWLADSTEHGTTIYDLLEAEGALQVRNLDQLGSVPYLFSFQKGFGPLSEVIAESQTDTIVMDVSIFENWPEGSWQSTRIGPSQQWNKVDLVLSKRGLSEADSVRIELYGETSTGSATLLRTADLLVDNPRATLDIGNIDHRQYPYIYTRFKAFDQEERSLATLADLFIDYRAPADVAINPQIEYTFTDSVGVGEDLTLTTGYENVSRADMDSLLIGLMITDEQNNSTTLRKRAAPLPTGGQGVISFTEPSTELVGKVRFSINLNPDQDQPEEVIFNNTLNTESKVIKDVVDPQMNVYFDGREISEGELVSAKPEILITLRDENLNRYLIDTSAFVVDLISPAGTAAGGARERLRFSDPRVEFVPPNSTDNVAQLYFRPTLDADGLYTLSVSGQDRDGNTAGQFSLNKSFEIVNEQRVSNVLTYPNPFSTQTRFVYTITGNKAPDVFRIQIMTVSGRVVRDIDLGSQEELRVGTHQTNFTWDGTDEYGDQLANGVYLYRVIARSNDEEVKRHDNGTDHYFEGNLGKVVILR